jgi:hypothetical protein
MAIISTNWQSQVTDLDAYVQGEQKPIPWLYGSNAPVSIDLAPALDEGEAIVDPTAQLFILHASGETDYVEYALGLEGTIGIAGTIVSQVLQDLERGRVYRLEVLFGAVNNRRGRSEMIKCV